MTTPRLDFVAFPDSLENEFYVLLLKCKHEWADNWWKRQNTWTEADLMSETNVVYFLMQSSDKWNSPQDSRSVLVCEENQRQLLSLSSPALKWSIEVAQRLNCTKEIIRKFYDKLTTDGNTLNTGEVLNVPCCPRMEESANVSSTTCFVGDSTRYSKKKLLSNRTDLRASYLSDCTALLYWVEWDD